MPRINTGRLNDSRIRAAYVLYKNGYSMRELADLLWEKWGYASSASCASSLSWSFRARGLATRSKSEAAVLGHKKRAI